MPRLTLHRTQARDLAPLARLLADPDDLALVNPQAAHPFDPGEWAMKRVGERNDETLYLLDHEGREAGFFAPRGGVGPEVRHLTYVFVEERSAGAPTRTSPGGRNTPRAISARSRSPSRWTSIMSAPSLSQGRV